MTERSKFVPALREGNSPAERFPEIRQTEGSSRVILLN